MPKSSALSAWVEAELCNTEISFSTTCHVISLCGSIGWAGKGVLCLLLRHQNWAYLFLSAMIFYWANLFVHYIKLTKCCVGVQVSSFVWWVKRVDWIGDKSPFTGLWPWILGLKCFNLIESSLSWLHSGDRPCLTDWSFIALSYLMS